METITNERFIKTLRDGTTVKAFLEEVLDKPLTEVELRDSAEGVWVKAKDEEGRKVSVGIYIEDTADPETVRQRLGLLDLDALWYGIPYDKLPDSYVITVLRDGKGVPANAVSKVKFGYKDVPDAAYDDGRHIVFLNSAYTRPNASAAVLEFLDYIRTGEMPDEPKGRIMASVKAKGLNK